MQLWAKPVYFAQLASPLDYAIMHRSHRSVEHAGLWLLIIDFIENFENFSETTSKEENNDLGGLGFGHERRLSGAAVLRELLC